MQALIPRDAADHHSAILEVRAGKSDCSNALSNHLSSPQGLGERRPPYSLQRSFRCTRDLQPISSGSLRCWKLMPVTLEGTRWAGERVD